MANKKDITSEVLILNQNKAQALSKKLLIFGGISLCICFVLALKDPHHFYFSYLVSFSFFTTLTLGALFFVLKQHISRAGWSVVVRRVPEVLMQNIRLMAVLFIPILIGMYDLYHWTHKEAVMHDHLLQWKAPYLNVGFFILRACAYFGIWFFLTKKLYNNSLAQDETGDSSITLNSQKTATYGILLFAITLTFAFIDWVMSLTPHWYSTIFGIYFFAGAMVVVMAALSLIFMGLSKFGYLSNIVTVEHYHDFGKWLYGFNIFWSYIAFSQYFLIWYANIPEETIWFASHFAGSWNFVAILLAVGHFAVPFIMFMSRHAKRCLPFNACMAIWLIFMHFVDMYWLVMPNAHPGGVHISMGDIVSFLGIGGVYFGFFIKNLSKVSLIPKNDPRLDESLNFKNF